MSPLKWILLVAFIVSAYWLWALYLIIAFIVLGAYFDTGKKSRSTRTTYKPYRFKRPKPTVYKAPRYKRTRPPNKGRLLKSGTRQHYRHGRWWPPAPKDNRPDWFKYTYALAYNHHICCHDCVCSRFPWEHVRCVGVEGRSTDTHNELVGVVPAIGVCGTRSTNHSVWRDTAHKGRDTTHNRRVDTARSHTTSYELKGTKMCTKMPWHRSVSTRTHRKYL